MWSDSIVLDTTAPLTTISPVGGTFMSDPVVTLTANESATIYYTTNGSDPTTNSSKYSGPITLNADATIKCFAVDEAGNQGAIVSEEYTVCTGSDLSITGVVRDATVDKTMPLVTITLDSGHSTSTDPEGGYSFTSLPRGYYKIESVTTASPGYVTYQKELMLCMTSITHDINLTKKATVFGGDSYSGYSHDSVNTATGNFTYAESDLQIPGRGLSFVFERSYNSQDHSDGPLGFGWTHNYNITLTVGAEDDVTVRWGDGKAETWVPKEGGGYEPMPGVFDKLIKLSNGKFRIRRKDLTIYDFSWANKLSKVVDENRNSLTFQYDGDNVTSVIDTVGRSIVFSYDADGRITRMLDPISRSVTYSYDVNGNLIQSTDMNGNTTTYTYDENHQILSVTDPMDNPVYRIVYDEQRRVVSSQKDALDAETLYSYDVANKVTQIVNPYGDSSYHYFDDMLRLIEERCPGQFSFLYLQRPRQLE